MSEKSQLIEDIESLKAEIREFESKRSRSMAVLLEAVISHTTPNETDVKFFRTYNGEIEMRRGHLQLLLKQLESLS